MAKKYDSLRIEVYGDGKFQGWLKSVSTYNHAITSTTNKAEAKTYAKNDTAMKDAMLANQIVRGTLSFNIA